MPALKLAVGLITYVLPTLVADNAAPAKEEVNELFEDYNNTAPLKFEKIADSALKGEEKKKQMLNKQKEEDELFGR